MSKIKNYYHDVICLRADYEWDDYERFHDDDIPDELIIEAFGQSSFDGYHQWIYFNIK